MAEELGERTELPTGRRLEEARSQGRVAKSQDFSSAVDLAGAVILIVLFGGGAMATMVAMLRRVLEDQVAGPALDVASVRSLAIWVGSAGVRVAGPGLLAMFILACLVQVAQVGWTVSSQPIMPNFSRLNPVAGLGKFFNLRSLVKTAVNVVKILVVGIVAYMVVARRLPAIAALPTLGMAAGMYEMGQMALELAIWLLAIFMALGLIDFFYQRWQHTHNLG